MAKVKETIVKLKADRMGYYLIGKGQWVLLWAIMLFLCVSVCLHSIFLIRLNHAQRGLQMLPEIKQQVLKLQEMDGVLKQGGKQG